MAEKATQGDPYVYNAQVWLNDTYRKYTSNGRYEEVLENGKTTWDTIYGLIRALQIELGIEETADNFGEGTEQAFRRKFPNGIHQQNDEDESENNVYGIIQCALLCKGYDFGVNHPTCHFYDGTGSAIKELKQDAGIADTSSTVTLNIMSSLLSMDYFYALDATQEMKNIQKIQRYLNRNYEEYTGLRPCDGVYGRRTNAALIYAIQAEGGLPVDMANGNFGPTTKACCPTIPYSGEETDFYYDTFSNEQIARFCKIINMGLYVNGIGNGEFNDTINESLIRQFQKKYAIPETGICDITTWLSLFVSCGDINRQALACDCATILDAEKARTLYDNGYRYVGRYLSGTAWGGVSKALSTEEIQIASDNGLSIFPIYQGSATEISDFSRENAIEDVRIAVESANSLHLPRGTNIYFAVDCDPLEYEIYDYIIPYFEVINEIMRNTYNSKYLVSIYGTRNVCNKVSSRNLARYSFVSDMSTGFSGNLGFAIPNNWAFDQFDTVTVGSGNGQIEIDKDGFSGRDLGIMGETTDVMKVYYSIVDMYNLALEYTNNNKEKSNLLVLQYIRKGKYGNKTILDGTTNEGGILDNFEWEIIAGEIDSNYCNLVDEKLNGLSFKFKDSFVNCEHDLQHLAATLNALLYDIGNDGGDELMDCYAGWAGDTVSFARDIKACIENYPNIDYVDWAKNVICTTSESVEKFGLQDYIDDLDAYNLSCIIINDKSTLPEAFYTYYISLSPETGKYKYQTRAINFIENMSYEHFNLLCELINSNEVPVKDLNALLSKNAKPEYIDAAIQAFKHFISREYIGGR